MTTVYFATNRKPNKVDAPSDFTEDIVGDLDSLRFGRADVPGNELYKDNDLKRIGRNAKIEVAPEKLHKSNALKSTVGSLKVFEQIRADMTKSACDAMIVVHGYNYTFRESVVRAAQLGQWFSDKPMTMLCFAWPSQGEGVSPGTYKDERRRAEASGVAMGRAILKATDFLRALPRNGQCGQRIHLLAHSMGNWALRGAVQSIRTFVGDNIPPLFDQVILIAADEDDDTLSNAKKLQPILRGSGRVSVYYNNGDIALKGSDWAMGNPDRLGRSGPEDVEELPAKIASINAAPVIVTDDEVGVDGSGPFETYEEWERDLTGHQYYRNNRHVRDDILQVLNGVPDEQITGRASRGSHWVLRS